MTMKINPGSISGNKPSGIIIDELDSMYGLPVKKYIIAGNYQEFRDYCRKNNKNPITDCVHIDNLSRLKGIHKPEGLLIGTWYARKDIQDILQQLRQAQSIDLRKYLIILDTRNKLLHE